MGKINFQLQNGLSLVRRLVKKLFKILLLVLLASIKWLFLSRFKKTVFFIFLFGFLIFCSYFTLVFLSLPRLMSMADYNPPLLTEVFDRNENKIGEIFKQRRKLFDYKDMPNHLIHAFVAAEDGDFFEHKGINYRAILRAFIANLKAGKKVQGGSTITQQVARTLLLSSKKTYTRKFKEAVLALRMENVLSKQDILYIYLNQIYLGHGSYGIEMASQIYFRKSVTELSLPEAAILAGLPKAPSRFSPIFNPQRAKSRQTYVLTRMREDAYISEKVLKQSLQTPIKVFVREKFNDLSPYYLETVRRLLLTQFDSDELLSSGLKIYTAMDLEKQKAAQKAVRKGLQSLDKRQGFRGVKTNLKTKQDKEKFFEDSKKSLKKILKTHLIIPGLEIKDLNGLSSEEDSDNLKDVLGSAISSFKIFDMSDKELQASVETNKNLLEGKIFKSFVSKIKKDKIEIQTIFGSKTLLLSDFDWAVPVDKKQEQKFLKSPSEIFKLGDVILVKVKEMESKNSAKKQKQGILLELYQEPLAEASLISFDLQNSDILAIVGGYDFKRSQFNRAYQSERQAGSIFKPFVYGAALAKNFRPDSIISDMPLVFSDEEAEEQAEKGETAEDQEIEESWRPENISNRFSGDILLRSALIRSLNVPTVKIIEKLGLDWVRFYVRRMGVFAPLNPDFTMALGSSSFTLYEIVKAFSVFSRQGKRLLPVLVHKVESASGEILLEDLSLDEFFKDKIQSTKDFVTEESTRWFPELKKDYKPTEVKIDERRQAWIDILKEDGEQLIPAHNSYIVNSLLEAIIFDPEGTARRARVLNRPLAGKTGTTNGYYDTWFVGYSPFISTGVWAGFDKEKTLGRGETGSRVALPIWMEYMKASHKDMPKDSFSIPEKIVFVNIDGEKGGLVSPETKKPVRQAFIEGTEPMMSAEDKKQTATDELLPSASQEDESDFIRGDFSK